jgi:proline iminopeptidase
MFKYQLPLTFLLFFVISIIAYPSPYTKAFGKKANPALIYLHDGPGYNSADFEYSAAKRLADMAQLYVIIYDRNGCGRNPRVDASKFTFNDSFLELETLYLHYKLQKATLLGVGFGGTLSVLFAEKYPDMVDRIILTNTPICQQWILKKIVFNAHKKYTDEKNMDELSYIKLLGQEDTNSFNYSLGCRNLAMRSMFYKPHIISPAARIIIDNLTSSQIISYLALYRDEELRGFCANERYASINLIPALQHLSLSNIPVFGIYGGDFIMIGDEHRKIWEESIPSGRITWVKDGLYNLFIDEQETCLQLIKQYMANE